ncbi:nephrocystin-4-like [Dendronephthya gigantea]|uniref:nephrocystin-4-like n=1 Tax=Dendronephthya gigantea TaxID=151771 RepID=UPI00106D24BA|nr:nephrocystin-4-like [Dendronephthya gigantea]
MADEGDDDSWENFFENNRSVPLHKTRREKEEGNSIPYRLNLKSVEGIPIPSFVNQKAVEFQVRVTLYDATNKHFFGSTWLGAYLPWRKMDENHAKISCNEALYFHSSLNDVTCVGAVEVIASDDVNGVSCSCGWGILRIFDSTISFEDSSQTRDIAASRLNFMRGTVQALLYMSEPLEDFPGLQPTPGFQLLYQLSRHSSLEKIVHLFPENALIGGDDIVPGVREGPPDANGIVDILYKPRIEKTFMAFIDKLHINLSPCVEDFEKNLIDDLNADRLLKINVQDGCNSVKIVERKLQVGVHNGWSFVSKPHIVVLEPEYAGQVKMGSRANSMSSLKGNITRLVLRSRLELSELFANKLLAIVFQLNYVMSEEFAKPVVVDNADDSGVRRKRTSWRNTGNSPTGSLVRSKSFNVCVRQGVWEPFKDGLIDDKMVTMTLQCGGHYHPGNVLTWSDVNGGKEPSEDTIHFRFASKRKSEQKRAGSKASTYQRLLSAPGSVGTAETYSTLGTQDIPEDHRTLQAAEPWNDKRMSFGSDFPPYQPAMMPERPPSHSPVVGMREISTTYNHRPLLPPGQTATRSSSGLTRAGHARLTSAQFPTILDRHGNPPIAVDPTVVRKYDLQYEKTDIRHCNEIVLQFLALSGCFHRTVFFTYQFYRLPEHTTERLALRDVENQAKSNAFLPCLLQKFNKDGSLDNQPGLQFKYSFDPCDMQPGEMRQLWKYLNNQYLHIDVWDGDSLLLVGSTSVELKHLLRQGQEAVQVVHELDILSTEYLDDSPALGGELVRNVSVKPVGASMRFEGKLHFRMANIGHPSENPSGKPCIVPRKQRHVVTAESNDSPYGGVPKRSKAKLMSECDQELATVLFSRDKDKNRNNDKKPTKQADAIRQRKLERMQAIRKAQKGLAVTTTHLIKEEKVQRARDLKTVQMYRQQCKKDGIMELLSRSITTNHTVHPCFGHAEFFEFVLKNPYASETSVIIQCDDNELMVVSDTREWKNFKKITQTVTNIEEDMFNLASDSGYPEVFMRPQESLNIPFKYQSFKTTHEQDSSNPLGTKIKDVTRKVANNGHSPRSIKVIFETPQQQRLGILSLNVQLQPVAVDQTFRFYSPEQTYFKKSIRLPPWHALTDEPLRDGEGPCEILVRCSDVNVICSTTSAGVDHPQDILLKVPCGASPSVRRFFLFIFTDPFLTRPKQTWQIYVHSLQRLDISSVQGQSSRLFCIVRGSHSSRLVQCYSSNPTELQVEPSDPFMLMANSVQEVSFVFNPSSPGSKQIFVNVVDTEFHQLVRSWLVCATCRPPVISKTFDMNVEVGGGKGSQKRIEFANPYPVGKIFYLKCDREDVLHFGDTTLNLGPGESQNIRLRFQPQNNPIQIQVLMFVYDEDGKNEETFLLNVLYR